MTTVKAHAPAKINLTLHVTGQRADGYHLLDSLVCFGETGDVITVAEADETRITVSGPFAAAVPTTPDNLVAQAAELLGVTAHIHIEKALPVAAGIGGGSADAAATVRALTTLYDMPIPDDETLLRLGADVPVCAHQGVVRMRGMGDLIDVVSDTPMAWETVLVNPGIPVSTPAVFARLATKTNTPMTEPIPEPTDADFPNWLADQRNDLEGPAVALAPDIGQALAILGQQPGCRIARMSGSGATCFALFERGRASHAVDTINQAHPNWWAVLAIS
ncbi:MAG: 4-(cytidine 5'-diphospho)-2-C-methyl-D-erythritol kinase [Pseudomonadota bacterium]